MPNWSTRIPLFPLRKSEVSLEEMNANPTLIGTQIQVRFVFIFNDHIFETSQLFIFIFKSKTKSNVHLL